MTRVFSALALLFLVVGVVWFLPQVGTIILAEVVVLLAFIEYADLSARAGAAFPRITSGVAVLASCTAMSLAPSTTPAVVMVGTIAIAIVQLSQGRNQGTLASVSAATFAVLYLGVPLGAVAALHSLGGREAVLLLLFAVIMSDIAQYYGGRLFGRRLLAPDISPKKTVEGALFGFLAGILVLLIVGHWWLAELSPSLRMFLGASVAGIGVLGDLFESSLKRIARVKDASHIIPGHGGMLDRLDSLLFAAPVYYIVVQLIR